MYIKKLHLVLMALLVVGLFASCGMKKAPDEEKEDKSTDPRTGAQVYKTSGLGNEVYSLAGQDFEGASIVVPSVSVYDYMDRVRKTLGRESKIDVNEECIGLIGIGQTNPTALEIDIKVDTECASLPEGEASHTDPSPLDDNDSWIICQPADGGVEDGPDGGDSGGGAPSANADNEGSTEKPGLGSIQSVLCGPAIGPRPEVDPRLVYPDPRKTDGMIVELAPCIRDFCPWKLIPIPLDPEDNPTDPVDPSPEDDVELPEEIKQKLPCDVIKNLCEPDLTFIDKNDLVKGDNDDEDITETEEWENCDGKNDDGTSRVENCSVGEVGDEDSDWKECGFFDTSTGSTYACVEHNADPQEGEAEYEVTINPNLDGGAEATDDQMTKAESKSSDIVILNYESQSNCTSGDQSARGKSVSTQVSCN